MRRKIAELINVIFGFRKFLLMLTLYIVGIAFRIKGLLSGAEMVDLFKSTTIAFMGANGVEHLVTMVRDVVASKNASKDAVNDAPKASPDDAVADTDESNDEEDVK